MFAYSRINKVENLTRSNSLDLSGSTQPPTSTPRSSFPAKEIAVPTHMSRSKPENMKSTGMNVEDDAETGHGEVFGIILSRRYRPDTYSSSDRFPCSYSALEDDHDQKEHVTCITTDLAKKEKKKKKRLFCIKRSASVTEGYSRIHSKHCHFSSAADDHPCNVDNAPCEEEQTVSHSEKRFLRNKDSRLMEACKRLFGL